MPHRLNFYEEKIEGVLFQFVGRSGGTWMVRRYREGEIQQAEVRFASLARARNSCREDLRYTVYRGLD